MLKKSLLDTTDGSRDVSEGHGNHNVRLRAVAERPPAPLSSGLLPKARSRFTFCPEAIIRASVFTFSSRLSLNLLKPCHSLASPNSGSTHTARLLRALR